MTVVNFPTIKRIPIAVRDTPAEVTQHPKTIGQFVVEGLAKLRSIGEEAEAQREASAQMQIVQRDLEMAVLRAKTLAKMHGREKQAVTMFEAATERLRRALATP